METVAPLFTALIALSMAISTVVRNPRDRLFQVYGFMAGVISVVFASLFFLILTKDEAWRYALLASALLVAPASFRVYEQLLVGTQPRVRPIILFLSALGVAQLCVVAWFGSRSPLTITSNGLIVFGGLALQLVWVIRLGSQLPLQSERRRLNLLVWGGGIAILLMSVEMLLFDWNLWRGQLGSPFLLPPIGSLAVAGYIYLLGMVISSPRVLDRREVLSTFLTFVLLTVALGSLYAVLARLVSPRTGPFAEGVNILLATVLLLILYEPLKVALQGRIGRLFARERADWLGSLAALKRRIPGLIEEGPLLEALLDGGYLEGRVDLATVYLYDRDRGFYRFRGLQGHPEQDPIQAIPHRPFIDGFLEGRRWYELDQLESEAVGRAGAPRPDWVESVLATMQAMQAELCVPLQIGTTVVGLWGLRTQPGAPGFAMSELVALHDIADQLAVAVDNTRAFERMKERDRLAALGEMSAGLAHEIRNPLGAIKGAVQVMARADLREMEQEFLDIIVEEVDRLNGVVSQFLDYARPMRVHAIDVQPDTLMQSVMALVVAEGLPPGVHVDYQPGVDVQPVPMDIEKLKQVVLNVVRNAIDSVTKAGGTLTIRTSAHGRDDPNDRVTSLRRVAPTAGVVQVRRGGIQSTRWVELSFEDDGGGITEEDSRKLFIPFFTTKAGGTGLGLPICERIMRVHGGEIEIASRPAIGTRFTLRLPLPEPEEDEATHDPDALTTIEGMHAPDPPPDAA